MESFNVEDIIVGTYPTYAKALQVAADKGHSYHGFIGIRATKEGFTVYCSI